VGHRACKSTTHTCHPAARQMLALQRSQIPVRRLAKRIGGWHEKGGLAAQGDGLTKQRGESRKVAGSWQPRLPDCAHPVLGRGKLGAATATATQAV
jgi:hypothetical protein